TPRSTTSRAAESLEAAELLPVSLPVVDVAGRVAGDVDGVGRTLTHPSGDADGDGAGGDGHAVRDQRPRAGQRTGTHARAVQHDGPGADEGTVLDDAALEMGEVPDDAVVADEGVELLGAVDDGAVLDRGPGADHDLAVVAAQDGLGPDRAGVAD